jgi:hypothetical protein
MNWYRPEPEIVDFECQECKKTLKNKEDVLFFKCSCGGKCYKK